MEEQWQPAIFSKIPTGEQPHAVGDDVSTVRGWVKFAGQRIRIKERENLSDGWICGTEREFQLHPDDAMRLFSWPTVSVCEHQILTD